MTGRDLLTVADVAARLGVSESTAARVVRRCQHLRIGRLLRVTVEEFERYLSDQTKDPSWASTATLVQALDAVFTSTPTMPAGTRRAHENQARQIVRVVGDRLLSSLRRDDVDRFVRARLAEGISQHTACKETNLLRLALRKAAERGEWGGSPAAVVQTVPAKYVPRQRWLTEQEVAGLIERLPSRRRWILVAVYTGARLGELERLRWRLELAEAGRPTDPVLEPWGQAARGLTAALGRVNGVPVWPGGSGKRRPAGWPRPVSDRTIRVRLPASLLAEIDRLRREPTGHERARVIREAIARAPLDDDGGSRLRSPSARVTTRRGGHLAAVCRFCTAPCRTSDARAASDGAERDSFSTEIA